MPDDTTEHTTHSIWQQLTPATAVLANIAIVAGIGFAALQLTQFRSAERRRIAIEATTPLRSPQFLDAYTKVTDAASTDPDIRHAASVLDDLYYIVSVYDNIARLYVSGLADKEVIRNEVQGRLDVLVSVMEATGWPTREERKNLNALVAATSAKP